MEPAAWYVVANTRCAACMATIYVRHLCIPTMVTMVATRATTPALFVLVVVIHCLAVTLIDRLPVPPPPRPIP